MRPADFKTLVRFARIEVVCSSCAEWLLLSKLAAAEGSKRPNSMLRPWSAISRHRHAFVGLLESGHSILRDPVSDHLCDTTLKIKSLLD